MHFPFSYMMHAGDIFKKPCRVRLQFVELIDISEKTFADKDNSPRNQR